MTKNGKSVQPNTGKHDTGHAETNEPTEQSNLIESQLSSQELESLNKFALSYEFISFPFGNRLRNCQQKAEELEKHEIKSHETLYTILTEVYEIFIAAYAKREIDKLRAKVMPLCNKKHYKSTKASNDFLIMIRAYTTYNKKRASNYAMALRFALAKGIKPDALVEFFKSEVRVEKCAKEFRKLNPKKTPTAKARKIAAEAVLPITFSDHKISKIKLGPRHSKVYRKALKMGEMELTMTGSLEQDGTMLVEHFKARPTEASKAILRGILETRMPKEAFRKRAQIWADTGR